MHPWVVSRRNPQIEMQEQTLGFASFPFPLVARVSLEMVE